MPNTVRELLGKWSLDNSGWQKSAADISKSVQQITNDDRKRAAANKSAVNESIAQQKQQLIIQQQISVAIGKAVQSEASVASAKKKTQDTASAAAAQAIREINAQTQAEKLREAAVKQVLAQQKAAAAEELAMQRAFQAQQNEVDRIQKARQTAYDAAYKAQQAEVARNNKKQNREQSTRVQQDFSAIPIVSAAEPKVELPEREVASVKKDLAEVANLSQNATSSVASTSEKILGQSEEAAGNYKKIAAAELEVARTSANVAETKAAIQKGTLEGQQAENRLALDRAAQDKALLELAEAKKLSEAAITKEQQKQLQLTEQRRAAEAIATRQNAEDAHRLELEQLKQQILKNDSIGGKKPGFFSSLVNGKNNGIGIGREEKDTVDALMGRQTIGPIDSLISKIPGLQTAIGAAFPILGVLTFVNMLKDLGDQISEDVQAFKKMPDVIKNGFGDAVQEVAEKTDRLKEATDQVFNQIAKLEHKPVNNAAIALDDARIRADELYSSLKQDSKAFDDLIQKSQQGFFQTKILGAVDTNDKQGTNLSGNIQNFNQLDETYARNLAAATRTGNKKDIDASNKALAQNRTNKYAWLKQQYDNLVSARDADYLASMPYGGQGLSQDEKNKYRDASNKRYANGINMLEGTYNLWQGNEAYNKQKSDKDNADDLLRKKEDANRQGELAIQDARSKLEDKRTNNAAELALTKQMIADEQDAENEAYQKGDEAAKQYYANKAKYAKQALDAQIKYINDNEDAELAELDLQRKDSPMSASAYASRRGTIISGADRARTEATTAYEKETSSARVEGNAAERQIALSQIQDELDAKRKALQLETQAVKSAYNEQTISGQDYLNKTLDLINQQVAAIEDAATKQQALGKNGTLQSLKEQQAGYEEGLKQLQDLQDNYVKGQYQNTQARFGNLNESLGNQLSNAQQQGGPQGYSNSVQLMSMQKDALDAQVQSLENLLDQSTKYSDTWFKIYNSILQATGQSAQLKQQLADSQDFLSQAGGPVSGLASVGSKAFRSRYAQHLFGSLGSAGELLSKSGDYRRQIFGGEQAQDPRLAAITQAANQASSGIVTSAKTSSTGLDSFASSLKTAKDALVESLQDLAVKIKSISGGDTGRLETESSKITDMVQTEDGPQFDQQSITPRTYQGASGGLKSIIGDVKGLFSGGKDATEKFSKSIVGATQAVGGFIDSISNAHSASGGALAGGTGAAGLASSFGVTNPYGMLASVAGGAILGGIMGQKQEQVEDDINALNLSYKKIMDSYSSNNSSLNSTITNLQSLIAQAQEEMASTKKGGDQYKDLIQQYNQQITQLEDQQKQIMSDLTNQLTVLGKAEPYQDMLSSIQDIIKQYSSYVGAAQNATQLAQANDYLTDSLKNLANSYTDQLRQNEEDAINDALQLNDLYNQRNQLQQQFLQQTEQIMGQGTVSRQLTKSQTKYSQLYNLDVNNANQMDSINQQIALEQYKVQAESQIFNLATTKAGLEAQSLTLQKQTIQLDMARISAMSVLLAQLQSGGYSLPGLGSVDTSDPNSLVSTLLGAFANNLSGNASGIDLTSASTATYNEFASYGYGNFRG